MNKEKEHELFRIAWKKWGKNAQLDMAIEECSELIKAICKYKRDPINLDNIIEEIAEVEIMTEQIKLIMNLEEYVKVKRLHKLKRLGETLGI